MAYGTIAEVAALSKRYAGASGDFTGAAPNQRPTAAEVTVFLNRISSMLDLMLAQLGYTVPVTNTESVLILDEFAVQHAVYLVYAANGAGPYSPGSEQLRGQTPFQMIAKEARAYFQDWGNGFELLGAERPRGYTYGLAATIEDADGDALEPPFDFDPDTEPIMGVLVESE